MIINIILIAIAVSVVALDQASKLLVYLTMDLNQQIDNVEVEPVNSTSNNYLELHSEDVSLDEMINHPS